MKNRNNFAGLSLYALVMISVSVSNLFAEVPSYEDLACREHEQRHVGFAILMSERIGVLESLLRRTCTKKLSLSEAQRLQVAVKDFSVNLQAIATCATYNQHGSDQCRMFLQDHLEELERFEARLRYQWAYIASRFELLKQFHDREAALNSIEQSHHSFYRALQRVKQVLGLAQ